MNEALLFRLVDLALNVVAVGLERDMIVSKVKELESNGSTPDQIVEALRDMRDQAILKAQDAINRA